LSLIHLIVLALIQGLTEFLPVSSSAHLILGSWLLGWPDQGLVTDVAVHFGTLIAVLYYFRETLFGMLRSLTRSQPDPAALQERKLAGYIVLASVPVILVGGLAHLWVEEYLRDVRVIAICTLGFGFVLWMADVWCARHRRLTDLGLKSALLIGLAQVLALVPGVSRSGITMTMGRMLGFEAGSAARFSFLLSIPVIAAAGVYGMVRVFNGNMTLDWAGFGLAVGFSALAGWACIAAFLALLERIGLLPFVYYRLVLGTVLLYLAW
jgi:undecaprenyl-diphosphatase